MCAMTARARSSRSKATPAASTTFCTDCVTGPPPLAIIESIVTEQIPVLGGTAFTIADTSRSGTGRTLASPDVAMCADCAAELRDPTNRRYRHPFVNCTNCGPRFTIIGSLPYDRATTTMAAFEMCADCAREYADPADRRFHAQPVCCPACGPQLRYLTPGHDVAHREDGLSRRPRASARRRRACRQGRRRLPPGLRRARHRRGRRVAAAEAPR